MPYQLVYLRQLRRQGRYAELRREAAKARDVLWPLARRRLGQRRKRLPTRRLLKPGFLGRVTDPGYGRSQSDLKERLLQDLLTYSLPCLLRYEDRNSMAFSIESRVPYLDQEFVDHILSLPDTAIVKDGWSRWILRAALKGTLPEKIRLRRWKVGFTTPEMRWIKARRAAFTSLYQSPSFQARPYWDGAAVVERVPRLLPRRGRGVHVLLARRQRRAVAARVRRPQRRARGRRHRGGARRAGRRRPEAPRLGGRGRRRAACRRCWPRPATPAGRARPRPSGC